MICNTAEGVITRLERVKKRKRRCSHEGDSLKGILNLSTTQYVKTSDLYSSYYKVYPSHSLWGIFFRFFPQTKHKGTDYLPRKLLRVLLHLKYQSYSFPLTRVLLVGRGGGCEFRHYYYNGGLHLSKVS